MSTKATRTAAVDEFLNLARVEVSEGGDACFFVLQALEGFFQLFFCLCAVGLVFFHIQAADLLMLTDDTGLGNSGIIPYHYMGIDVFFFQYRR